MCHATLNAGTLLRRVVKWDEVKAKSFLDEPSGSGIPLLPVLQGQSLHLTHVVQLEANLSLSLVLSESFHKLQFACEVQLLLICCGPCIDSYHSDMCGPCTDSHHIE